jgi:hypothetical protein
MVSEECALCVNEEGGRSAIWAFQVHLIFVIMNSLKKIAAPISSNNGNMNFQATLNHSSHIFKIQNYYKTKLRQINRGFKFLF